MGFTPTKILEYVQERFAHDKERADRIWDHISCNLELLSLCHIPVNTCIICSLLEECLKLQEQNPTHMALPSTSTTIWKGALKLFIFKHHSEFKGKSLTEDFLMGNIDFPDTVEETLNKAGVLAKEGIEQGRLVFDSHEVQGMENCGLFTAYKTETFQASNFSCNTAFFTRHFKNFLLQGKLPK